MIVGKWGDALFARQSVPVGQSVCRLAIAAVSLHLEVFSTEKVWCVTSRLGLWTVDWDWYLHLKVLLAASVVIFASEMGFLVAYVSISEMFPQSSASRGVFCSWWCCFARRITIALGLIIFPWNFSDCISVWLYLFFVTASPLFHSWFFFIFPLSSSF